MATRFEEFCKTKGRPIEPLLPETLALYAPAVVFEEHDQVAVVYGFANTSKFEIEPETGKLKGVVLQHATGTSRAFCKCNKDGWWVLFCTRHARNKDFVLYNILLTLLHVIPVVLLCFFFAAILGIWVNSGGLSQTSLSYICKPEEIFFPWRKTHCTVVPFVAIFFVLVSLALARFLWLYFVAFQQAKPHSTHQLQNGSITTRIVTVFEMIVFAFFILVFVIAFLVILLAAFKNPMDYIAYGTAVSAFIAFLLIEIEALNRRRSEFSTFARKTVQDELSEMIRQKRASKAKKMEKQK